MDREQRDYPDLVRLNTNRALLDAVGADLLEQTVAEHLAMLETAMTVFETNGDYATGDRPHGWCRVMDELSMPEGATTVEIDSGRWSCRSACRQPALDAMERGAPTDFVCPGGMKVHAAPIRAGDEIVGSVSVGSGGPPTDEETLRKLAATLGAEPARLREAAVALSSHPAPSEATARHVANATARLLGEIIAVRRLGVDRARARELFTGMVAHDLRTPLASIAIGVESLLSRTLPPEVVAQRLERIRRSVRRASRMIEDLVDLTRMSAGGSIPLRLQRQPLDALLADVVEDMRLAHPDAAIRLHTGGDTVADCDADRLREVFENLLGNAIRHGGAEPIDVEIHGRAGTIEVRVHNGGTPIPPEVLPHIFEPFDQGGLRREIASAAMRRSQGLGLGLYITREFVRAHGGEVDATSDARNGTTFTVRLPRSPIPDEEHGNALH